METKMKLSKIVKEVLRYNGSAKIYVQKINEPTNDEILCEVCACGIRLTFKNPYNFSDILFESVFDHAYELKKIIF